MKSIVTVWKIKGGVPIGLRFPYCGSSGSVNTAAIEDISLQSPSQVSHSILDLFFETSGANQRMLVMCNLKKPLFRFPWNVRPFHTIEVMTVMK